MFSFKQDFVGRKLQDLSGLNLFLFLFFAMFSGSSWLLVVSVVCSVFIFFFRFVGVCRMFVVLGGVQLLFAPFLWFFVFFLRFPRFVVISILTRNDFVGFVYVVFFLCFCVRDACWFLVVSVGCKCFRFNKDSSEFVGFQWLCSWFQLFLVVFSCSYLFLMASMVCSAFNLIRICRNLLGVHGLWWFSLFFLLVFVCSFLGSWRLRWFVAFSF